MILSVFRELGHITGTVVDLRQGQSRANIPLGTSSSMEATRLPDTHCSLELRAGLFSTLYSLSTSCCYKRIQQDNGQKSWETQAQHEDTWRFNPLPIIIPLTIPFFLTDNGKTKCKTVTQTSSSAPSWPARVSWLPFTLSRASPFRNWLWSSTEKMLKGEKRAGTPLRKGLIPLGWRH